MLNTQIFKCTSVEEIKLNTDLLDKAVVVSPLRFDVLGVNKETTQWRGIFNITQDRFTKPISEMYHLVTHKEFLDSFADALQNLNLKFEMHINSMGNTIITDILFLDKKIEMVKLNEEFIVGIRLINSYDRSYAITISPRLLRLVCTNGMVLVKDETIFSIKHSSKLAKQIETLVETKISEIINKTEYLQKLVEESIGDSIEWKYAGKILEKLLKQDKHTDGILKNLGITRIETKNPLDKKKPVITYIGLEEGVKLTRWQIYNAITAYLTHNEQLSPYVETVMQSKAEKLLLTPLQQAIKIE